MVDGPLFESVRTALRVSATAYDDEVEVIIEAARDDLQLSGVAAVAAEADDPDPLIKRAIILYAKANFGLDNPDSEKYQLSYDALKRHLCISSEYQETVS